MPDRPQKGRGALSNRDGRYEPTFRTLVDDGWAGGGEQGDPPVLRTTVTRDESRTVITRNRSPDVPFEQSINPYRGCEHGCIYCFARPTHAYLGLSPGLDFESRLFAKPDAPSLLRRELSRRGYRPSVLAIGTNTDPYQPVERRLRIMRGILEVLAECRHPVTITTKSSLVVRDLDILAPMAAQNLASVALSITTLDGRLARTLEPRAPAPAKRLAAIERLNGAGVPTAVMVAPVIPAITDHELETIIERAAMAGAPAAGYILLRLPLEIRDLFQEWLEAHFPDRAKRVLNRMRAMRDGRLYVDAYGTRMRGTGVDADLLERRFRLVCRRLGLDKGRGRLATDKFTPPDRTGRQPNLL